MPAVSVIIPCYNQQKYIGQTLDSVLTQTFEDYEIIVINDGSTDDSLTIIESYVSRFDGKLHILNQKNQGVVSARNNGVEKAKGKWIFPLDGDDKIAPTCLEKLYAVATAGKGDVIYCLIRSFGAKDECIYFEEPTMLNMCRSNQVCASALYRKSDFERYGGYDPSFNDGLEDWDFWLNFIADDKKFYKVDDILLFYRITENSRTSSVNREKKKEIRHRLKKKYHKLYTKMAFKLFLYKLKNFFYQKKVRNSKLTIKIFKIPVFFKQINT